MAPPLLYDLSRLDLSKIEVPLEEIRKVNPHRFEMEQLSGIIHIDRENITIVGVREVRMDEFWIRGHIPGRPLLPGVLMIESAAQLCSYAGRVLIPDMGFIGFARCDEGKFRGTVIPPATLYIIAKMVDVNRRRIVAECQGVCNGSLVFECQITGMPV